MKDIRCILGRHDWFKQFNPTYSPEIPELNQKAEHLIVVTGVCMRYGCNKKLTPIKIKIEVAQDGDLKYTVLRRSEA